MDGMWDAMGGMTCLMVLGPIVLIAALVGLAIVIFRRGGPVRGRPG